MSSDLKAQITDAMKSAMKGGDKNTLGAIRLILSAIKDKEIETREDVTDKDVTDVLQKMAKKYQDSISQYSNAGRDDLASKEEFELSVVKNYLPESMSEQETTELIQKIIDDNNISGMNQMGLVMKELKAFSDKPIDMGLASQITKKLLS
ncbi:MAG: glutamyl-tRNA amidotransferase [Gammaproteobacteria bacterium]|nr:glutamyl-tRNA amidotransferase [Gammaproteobacteria bacterium]